MYTALQISSHFIKKGVSPLKLQKLLFYAQVWFYAKTGKKLFVDNIEAWVLGPVVPSVWQQYRHMRRGDEINDRKADYSAVLSDDIHAHLDEIWRAYGKFTGVELVDITHAENLWVDARAGLEDHINSKNIIFINDNILDDFKLDRYGYIPAADKKSPGYGQINGSVGEELF